MGCRSLVIAGFKSSTRQPDDWTQARTIDARSSCGRRDAKTAGRPDPLNGRTSMTLVPGMTRLNENTSDLPTPDLNPAL